MDFMFILTKIAFFLSGQIKSCPICADYATMRVFCGEIRKKDGQIGRPLYSFVVKLRLHCSIYVLHVVVLFDSLDEFLDICLSISLKNLEV